MLRLKTIYLTASLAILGVFPLNFPAAAAEAYLCEDGRLVYVEVKDLEKMKRTDPCVAAYYRLENSNKKIAASPVKSKSVLRTKRAVTSRQTKPKSAKFPLPLKRLQTETHDTNFSLELGTTAKVHKQSNEPAVIDYRNIPVINASPGSPSWYFHGNK